MNHKNRLVLLLASASLLAACATAPQTAEVAAARSARAVAPAAPAEPAPVSALVSEVAIPHQSFQLANGLTVHRPRGPQGAGRRGQHLVQCRVQGRAQGQDRLRPSVRASDVQRLGESARRLSSNICSRSARPITTARPGSTAPIISRRSRRGALERALFMESRPHGLSARRGHPGASSITSAASSRTRSARATTSRAGWSFYEVLENLFPEGHPYRHSTIGSMADLDAASLADVKQLVHRQIWPEQCGAGARRRHRRGRGAAAGREIFRRRSRAARSTCRPRPTCRRWRRPSRS